MTKIIKHDFVCIVHCQAIKNCECTIYNTPDQEEDGEFEFPFMCLHGMEAEWEKIKKVKQ
jgi:hypothetical protein